jgi:hypothetical protein
MYKPNALSALGRLGYGVHLLAYPLAGAFYYFVISPELERRGKAAEQAEWDMMAKARKVDPDLFNPFSAVPYHNNLELKYVFAHVNMHGYLNKNQINPKEYVWKSYHNSYDHNNKGEYLYNWTSVHSPRDHH